MSDLSDLRRSFGEPPERVRYFPRQLITADDMRAEQEYFREKARRHNRYLHGWGVVCGCDVQLVEGSPWTVRVCPGYAVAPQGDEINIDQFIDVPLNTGPQSQPCTVRWPCPPNGSAVASEGGSITVYVAVRYAECFSRPVSVHPAGCGCDETGCEYSRIRDSFEVKVLLALPQSHLRAKQHDEAWCATVANAAPELLKTHLYPVPPCPECFDEPWVVLTSITIDPGSSSASGGSQPKLSLSITDRRVLLPTNRMQVANLCLP